MSVPSLNNVYAQVPMNLQSSAPPGYQSSGLYQGAMNTQLPNVQAQSAPDFGSYLQQFGQMNQPGGPSLGQVYGMAQNIPGVSQVGSAVGQGFNNLMGSFGPIGSTAGSFLSSLFGF